MNISETHPGIPIDGPTTQVQCKICGKSFTKRGINVHLAKSHATSSQTSQGPELNITNAADSETPGNEASCVCPHCGCLFTSSHGIKIHISILKSTDKNLSMDMQKLRMKPTTQKGVHLKAAHLSFLLVLTLNPPYQNLKKK